MASNDPNNDFFDDEEGNFVLVNNKKLPKRGMWYNDKREKKLYYISLCVCFLRR